MFLAGHNPKDVPVKRPVTYDYIKELFLAHNYPFLENEILPFGIRSKDTTVDKWNDTLGIVYPDKQILAYSGTTDPGASPLARTEGVNPKGIFILQPGFYKNCWHKGKHKGKYDALVQFGYGIFKGWRDNDKDGKLDFSGPTQANVTGLNFHTTRWDKQVMHVGEFSHACQVVEVAKEYDTIMSDVVFKSEQSLFSYALFQEK